MKDVMEEKDLKKYRWLHRIHVSAVLYVLIDTASKLDGLLQIKQTYLPLVALYLIFPWRIDSVLFRKRFYGITLVISGTVFIGTPGSTTTKSILNFLGTPTWMLIFAIWVNSIFVIKRVFKTDLGTLLKEPLWGADNTTEKKS